jgi:hypothetical protein
MALSQKVLLKATKNAAAAPPAQAMTSSARVRSSPCV